MDENRRSYADEDLVPVTAAAKIIGVSRTTMRKYADEGLVPSQRTPTNHRRFRVGDLRRLNAVEQPAGEQDQAVEDLDEEPEGAPVRRGAA